MNALWEITEAMKATGNQPGIIARWKELVEGWAKSMPPAADKQAVLAWLPFWQARPLYSAIELAPIIPALAVALKLAPRMTAPMGAARLENALRATRLPYREIQGKLYFAVERCHWWRKAPDSEWEVEIFHAQR